MILINNRFINILVVLSTVLSCVLGKPSRNRGVWNTTACNSPEILQQAYETEGNFLCTDLGGTFNIKRGSTCLDEVLNNPEGMGYPSEIYLKHLPDKECADQLIDYYRPSEHRSVIYDGKCPGSVTSTVAPVRLESHGFALKPWSAYQQKMMQELATNNQH